MSDYLQRVNQETVAPELLREVLTMYALMPAEDRSVFEARAFRLFELLQARGLAADSDLPMAIEFRLEALASLQGERALGAWTLPGKQGGDGAVYVHADLVKAAAEEPLVETNAGRPGFDPDSFKRRVLAISDMRGTA